MRTIMNRCAVNLFGFLILSGTAAMAQPGTLPAVPLNPPPNAPWFNASLTVDQRAAALVSQMTRSLLMPPVEK